MFSVAVVLGDALNNMFLSCKLVLPAGHSMHISMKCAAEACYRTVTMCSAARTTTLARTVTMCSAARTTTLAGLWPIGHGCDQLVTICTVCCTILTWASVTFMGGGTLWATHGEAPARVGPECGPLVRSIGKVLFFHNKNRF